MNNYKVLHGYTIFEDGTIFSKRTWKKVSDNYF